MSDSGSDDEGPNWAPEDLTGVRLPFLPEGASIDEAIDRLIEYNRRGSASAVVVARGDDVLLVHGEALIRAAQGNGGGAAAMTAEILLPDEPFGYTTWPELPDTGYDPEPGEGRRHLPEGNRAKDLRRDERYLAHLSVHLSLCRCTGPIRHPWSASQLRDRNKCNICKFPVVCS